jgi:hypothetical protein
MNKTNEELHWELQELKHENKQLKEQLILSYEKNGD